MSGPGTVRYVNGVPGTLFVRKNAADNRDEKASPAKNIPEQTEEASFLYNSIHSMSIFIMEVVREHSNVMMWHDLIRTALLDNMGYEHRKHVFR